MVKAKKNKVTTAKAPKAEKKQRTKRERAKPEAKVVPDVQLRLTKQNKRSIIRRNKTAWIYFCTAKRPEVVEATPGQTFGETCKKLAHMWHNLSQADRQSYIQLAEDDRKRYVHSSQTLSDTQKKFLKRYRRAKREQRKSYPKTALSPYMYFVIDRRLSLVKSQPLNTKFEDIGRLLGERWTNLPEYDRQQYIIKSNDDKLRYQQEMFAYNQSQLASQA